jgi:hypothetical protein
MTFGSPTNTIFSSDMLCFMLHPNALKYWALYDNEAGKGNHLHIHAQEQAYQFVSVEQLLKDFFAQIKQMENTL